LFSHEVTVELTGATGTRSGLRVQAELDRGASPLGVKVSDKPRCRPDGGARSRMKIGRLPADAGCPWSSEAVDKPGAGSRAVGPSLSP
jgi:hypothetical protein